MSVGSLGIHRAVGMSGNPSSMGKRIPVSFMCFCQGAFGASPYSGLLLPPAGEELGTILYK